MKNNKGLLDKKRFVKMEAERIKHLQGLTVKQSIKIMERLLVSGVAEELRRIRAKLV